MTNQPDLVKTDAAKQVDEYIRSLVKCARALPKNEWRWGQFTRPDGSPIETVDHVCEAQEKSARMSDKAELWGVDLGVDASVVCYTGNGPRSKDHAQYIAAARPEIIIWILDNLGERIQSLESRVGALEGALEPFARSSERDWDDDAPGDTEVWNSQGLGWPTSQASFNVGDLRRARAALAGDAG